jgi:outer membrane protein OmpA-like peptidoglycan-associated protein
MTQRISRWLLPYSTVASLILVVPIAEASETGAFDDSPLPAKPGDFTLKVEPGVSVPLTTPQSQRFKVGGGETIKALWGLNRYLDLGPSATFLFLPGEASGSAAGTAWTFGGSLRVKRPHDLADDDAFFGISPWADVDALYVRTGPLDRPGFAVGVGASVPIGRARIFWVGPFARYFQIIQPERAGFDDHDAKTLTLGVSLEVGFGVERNRDRVMVEPASTSNIETSVCPDRDKDGIPDNVDHCPDVAGLGDNWGCPAYKLLVVKSDKLELKEKLYFAWDKAVLQEVSFPVLDEVVQALTDNKGFRVQVEGHTSSEGTDDHNQTLSEQRAEAVLDYLVAHGIGKERLVSKGFSSSVPADTNATVAGRENNRRVEFVVQFVILNGGSN